MTGEACTESRSYIKQRPAPVCQPSHTVLDSDTHTHTHTHTRWHPLSELTQADLPPHAAPDPNPPRRPHLWVYPFSPDSHVSSDFVFVVATFEITQSQLRRLTYRSFLYWWRVSLEMTGRRRSWMNGPVIRRLQSPVLTRKVDLMCGFTTQPTFWQTFGRCSDCWWMLETKCYKDIFRQVLHYTDRFLSCSWSKIKSYYNTPGD